MRNPCRWALILMTALALWGQPAKSPGDDVFQEASIALRAKDWSKAEFWFKRMRVEYPTDRRWGPGMMAALEGQNKTLEALRVAREVQPLFAEEPTHNLAIGRLLVKLERLDEALREFQTGLQHAKTVSATALAHSMIGDVHWRRGDVETAIAEFRKVKDLTGQGYVMLALALDAQENHEAAMTEYREVLRSDPNNVIALNNLAYSLAERGESLNEALAMIQRAMTVYPSETNFVDTLGWVLFKLGRLEEAETTMIDALRLEGGLQPVLREHLAKVMDARFLWTEDRRILRGLMDRNLRADDVARMKELLRELK